MSSSPYSFSNFIRFIGENFAIIFIVGLFFLAGFMAGSVWTENQMLKNGTGSGTPTAAGTGTGDTAAAPTGPTEDQLKQAKAVSDEDHIQGNKNAKVVLVEYSDFECPFCARFHPTAKQLKEEFGDQVAWVYRHYPLSFHPNAQKSAEAVECVVEQKGKNSFWEFADKIFEENNKLGGTLTPETAKTVALTMGINESQFDSCLSSGKYAQKVKDQMTDGSAAGITGTPGTIILSGDSAELIPGAVPFEQAKAQIEKYL